MIVLALSLSGLILSASPALAQSGGCTDPGSGIFDDLGASLDGVDDTALEAEEIPLPVERPIEDVRDLFAVEAPWVIRIDGWDPARTSPEALTDEVEIPGAVLSIYRGDPNLSTHCPEPSAEELEHRSDDFGIRTSGNFTKGTPKSSLKIDFGGKKQRWLGMDKLNLKAMWNDPSQMREALAWELLAAAGVPASGHGYARVCIGGQYMGLFSMIEQVDEAFLGDRFGKNDDGNLYKAYWGDIGPATLEHRAGADGDDSGAQYRLSGDMDQRSWRLKTNDAEDDDPAHQSYDDLAQLARVINGVGFEGRGDQVFESREWQRAVEDIFDVEAFLRWAGTSMLLGAWDNYWATPANYYLYNSGKAGAAKQFMEHPYFHFIPWDYDNSLGVDRFGTAWQHADLLDWSAATRSYHGGQGESRLPMIENLLKNEYFRSYYLDHIEHMLDTRFNERWFGARIGQEGSGGLWDQVRHAAFLEADSPTGPSHTGRQYTNDQVYWNGFEGYELDKDGQHTTGILHYVRMRHDSARAQLERLRRKIPAGSSDARFPAEPTPLPEPRG
jgi:hypothetical protein